MKRLFGMLCSALIMVLIGLPAQANDVTLTRSDIVQIGPKIWHARGLTLPEPNAALPMVGDENRKNGARLLRIFNGRGDVNGFREIVYDNRDRGHSTLDPELYPRLTHLKYDADLAGENLDLGLAGHIILPAVVLGNSSAAIRKGSAPRSLPRLAMTSNFWRAMMPVLYMNNHIYVYPEHRDHDAADRYPVNWPYTVISQGSSGSDKRFLNAIALTLAALPRETFNALRENGLVAPTIQMILRRNLETVSSREDYLSGLAHPPVFDGRQVRTDKMMAQAAELLPDDIPPVVLLKVVEEDFSEAAGLAKLNERLLDSPFAIGRLWRGFAGERHLLVSAEETSAPNDRDVTFEWRLLRGDPERVRIEPQGPNRSTARIHVSWHDPWIELYPHKKGFRERRFSRVDIGVFANNGVHDSAPSLISIDFPAHQIREYSTDADGLRVLRSIDYDALGRDAYFDPLLYWSAGWTDTAQYDDNGVLSGWNRREWENYTTEFVASEGGSRADLYEIDRTKPKFPKLRRVSE